MVNLNIVSVVSKKTLTVRRLHISMKNILVSSEGLHDNAELQRG